MNGEIQLRNHLEFSGSKIIFFGGAGFIGKSVLDFLNNLHTSPCINLVLVSRGFKDIDITRWKNLNIQWIKKPIEEISVHDFNPTVDYVIHGATSTNDEARELNYLAETTLKGTRRILDICTRLKPKGFLYLSSGAIYGLKNVNPISFKETDLFAPLPTDLSEIYGQFKRLNETLCADFFEKTKIPTTIARCFTFSGKNLESNAHFAITQFIKAAKDGKNIKILGNGRATRSYLDEEDLSHWLLSLLERNKGLDVINVGSATPTSINELAQSILNFYPHLKLEILNIENIPENYYVPDVSKAMNKYGLTQTISLDMSLKKMIKS
jgi:nucleoside-diphosphate-sugar epimerase